MVAVAREVLHLDLGARDALLDQVDDIGGFHRHLAGFLLFLRRYSLAFI
jgi:hypothetical protein